MRAGPAAAVTRDLSEYGFTVGRGLVHVAISIRVDDLSMSDGSDFYLREENEPNTELMAEST